MLEMALELNNGVEEGTDFLKTALDFWIIHMTCRTCSAFLYARGVETYVTVV